MCLSYEDVDPEIASDVRISEIGLGCIKTHTRWRSTIY